MFLSDRIFIETWANREIAVIKGRGYILGQIESVESESSRHDKQHVEIETNNVARILGFESNDSDSKSGTTRWTLQASAKSIQKDNIVCLFQGTTSPTILGICKDYFAVIMIRVTQQRKQLKDVDVEYLMRDTLSGTENQTRQSCRKQTVLRVGQRRII